jgi:hypothetical protein
LCCARCGEPFQAGARSGVDPASDYDGWEMDEQLRHIERTLQAIIPTSVAESGNESPRFDHPHASSKAWHISMGVSADDAKPAEADRKSLLQTVSWSALMLGTACFTCGAILSAWSLIAGRPELWTIGLPTACGGQLSLLFGLVLQVVRISREKSRKLESVARREVTSSGCRRPNATALAVAWGDSRDRLIGSSS